MFCSVFLSGSVKTISRVKRSFGVILAIFGHFCKTEKARIGAISWADIVSVWAPLSIFKKLARWHPVQKRYSIYSRPLFSFNDPEPFQLEKDYILGHYEVKKKHRHRDLISSWQSERSVSYPLHHYFETLFVILHNLELNSEIDKIDLFWNNFKFLD